MDLQAKVEYQRMAFPMHGADVMIARFRSHYDALKRRLAQRLLDNANPTFPEVDMEIVIRQAAHDGLRKFGLACPSIT